ncbi:retrotransposon protein, putative, ty1-copia subclass [Tanacetum coccineum]
MAATAQNTNNTTIRSILLAEKLTGSNFTNWYRNLRIVLSMSPDLQRTLEKYNAYDMLKELKTMFEEQVKQELFEIVKAFHACKHEEGQSVSSYLFKMKSYLDKLERLGYDMLKELGVSLILNSLNKDYDQFVQNYNMHSMGKTIAELHAMLKLYEKGIPKKAETLAVLAIREGKIQKYKKIPRGAKGKDKGKNKLAYDPSPKILLPSKRDYPAKDFVCHHCKEVGHWRRNCLSYQVELKKRKNASVASTSCIFTIKLYAFPNKTWVYDTGCAVEAIGSSDLILPSGLMIVLDNCHFAPSVTRGVVLISHLVNNDYIHTFRNYGIYEIDMHNLYPNVSFMFNVSNKGAKHMLDSSYLWHYSFGHINKKHMDKLQRDGILQPNYDESPEKCKSCISGKMARKPFPHQVEIAKDLLGLIHTDVCGPFRTVSREGASYFITFTDDFRRYGDLNEPHNYKAALSDPEFDKWLEAMNTEMQSMKDNQVWVLVDLPPNGRTVRSKWLFKKKTDMDGNVHTFKARLVAKGYTQTYGVDYRETFSHVPDIKAIRILLAITDIYDFEIWQRNVKTAFLNGHLSEDIYMVQPEGFVDQKHPNKVCKLQRSIYRLKQASRSWNKRFDEEIKKIVFTQNPNEPCVYLKASGSNVAFLILYVDDILLMGNNVIMLSKRLIALSQSAYLEKILKKFWMENSKKGYTVMIEKPDYRKSQGAKTPSEVQLMQRVPYASTIGSIMYAVRCTRPDVAFVQNLCSRFQQNPGEIHWTAVKAILKYLRNTKDMVLVYGAKPEAELKVSCYADASFQTDKDDTKSQTGYVFILIAEYIAAAEASMEAVWMIKFIDGLGGVMPSNKRPMEMLCDNEPAIAIANDPGILKGLRHFQRKYHYIREVIQEREIVLKKVHTNDNVADPVYKTNAVQ